MPETFIGTDIVSVSRIDRSINSTTGERFIDRIFTDVEIAYCKSKLNPSIHFAGRFAAKEAVMKALLSSDKIDFIKMKSIEILTAKNGKPEVNLIIDNIIKHECKVSISHSNDFAVAFAIFEVIE